MVVDTKAGVVVVREAESILGITHELTLTPHQAWMLGEKLEAEGEHTVAADGLRRAAVDAEKWAF